MADSKLSELTAATSAAASDLMYIVQSSTSKKITVANLFSSLDMPLVVSDKLQIQGSQRLTSGGAISVTETITYITNPDSSAALTLAAGSEGQVKIVIMTSNTGGASMTLSGSSVSGVIVFDQEGDTATLIYTDNKWFMVGGSATIV